MRILLALFLAPAALVLAVLAPAAHAADPRSQIVVGNVLTCDSSSHCFNKIVDGRTYQVLSSPNLTVMVSLSTIGNYIRADVDITNAAGQQIRVQPEDFRIDVLHPKPGRLDVVPAASLHLPPPPKPKAAKSSALPPAPLVAPKPDPDLLFATLEEKGTAHGRIFFAGSRKANTVNLVLPISGSVFEFPYKF